MDSGTEADILSRLRDFLATAELSDGGRVPAERVLAETLGVGRGALR